MVWRPGPISSTTTLPHSPPESPRSPRCLLFPPSFIFFFYSLTPLLTSTHPRLVALFYTEAFALEFHHFSCEEKRGIFTLKNHSPVLTMQYLRERAHTRVHTLLIFRGKRPKHSICTAEPSHFKGHRKRDGWIEGAAISWLSGLNLPCAVLLTSVVRRFSKHLRACACKAAAPPPPNHLPLTPPQAHHPP